MTSREHKQRFACFVGQFCRERNLSLKKLRKVYTRKNEQMKIVALNRLYVYTQHVYNRPNPSEKSEWVLGGGGGRGVVARNVQKLV